MGLPASIKGDMVLQTPPVHCHQPHPMGPAQVPIPLPVAPPLKMEATHAKKVKIGGKEAIRVGDKTKDDNIPGCPKPKAGPGEVAMGSTTVKIEGKFAARILDMTKHAACTAPIPAPVGKIMGPGCATVMIG
ncbi:MAG: PAAR domain-containing protein [Myxococcota bacterium]|nr:PAAR domain-containing protein [Myxococcota bacterium]